MSWIFIYYTWHENTFLHEMKFRIQNISPSFLCANENHRKLDSCHLLLLSSRMWIVDVCNKIFTTSFAACLVNKIEEDFHIIRKTETLLGLEWEKVLQCVKSREILKTKAKSCPHGGTNMTRIWLTFYIILACSHTSKTTVGRIYYNFGFWCRLDDKWHNTRVVNGIIWCEAFGRFSVWLSRRLWRWRYESESVLFQISCEYIWRETSSKCFLFHISFNSMSKLPFTVASSPFFSWFSRGLN